MSATVDRKDILLRAAFDLLRRSMSAGYVMEASDIHVHYDEADCDGYCLCDDIASEIGIDSRAQPIPLEGNDE